jgi:hypothetical protein
MIEDANSVKWVRRCFRAAALYGLLALLPQYLRAAPAGGEANVYGFVGTATAFQLAFWVIGGNPVRYRALMPVAVVEKLAFGLPCVMLFAQAKVDTTLLAAGAIDLLLGVAFLAAWRATPVRHAS